MHRLFHASQVGRHTLNGMACFVGICVHLLHLCLRMHRMQNVVKCDCSWESFQNDNMDETWIDWVSFMSDILSDLI
jgi:hypothetical protein